jgi:phosphatidylglycerophosphate synthase
MIAETVRRSALPPETRPRARDFLVQMRGGGPLTVALSQRAGAHLCVPAYRLGLHPRVLTLGGLVCGTAGAVLVLLGGARPHTDLVAVLLWQLAYCLDCADGQLARYTGRAGKAGARLDVMCDLAVHAAVVVAITVSTVRHDPATPTWLTSAFACAVMINLCGSVLVPSGPAAGSLSPGRNRGLRRAGSLIVDYPVFLSAYAGFAVFVPGSLDLFLAAVLAISCLLLAVRLGRAAQVSVRGPRP